jgi:hypothetical protein
MDPGVATIVDAVVTDVVAIVGSSNPRDMPTEA